MLRTGVWTARANRPAVDRAADGARLASYAVELLALADTAASDPSRPPTVAAYAGVGDEPPTRQLLDTLVAAGAHVLLPVVADKLPGEALDWAPYDGWDALVPSRWQLKEPATQRLGPTALARYMSNAVKVSGRNPVLIDRYLQDAIEGAAFFEVEQGVLGGRPIDGTTRGDVVLDHRWTTPSLD